MATTKRKVNFFESEEGAAVKQALTDIAADKAYNTKSSYSIAVQYADHLIPFVDKHMNYLNGHPSIDPEQYVSNLRLITKIR
ncbi:MAG: hypothetical protein WCJ24_00655 [Candidatus Saccharibacteria bacterium]